MSVWLNTLHIFLRDVFLQADYDLMRGVSWNKLQNENEYVIYCPFSDLWIVLFTETLKPKKLFYTSTVELILMVIVLGLGDMHKAWGNL